MGKLAFIGGGNMALALASGLLREGWNGADLRIADPLTEARQKIQSRLPAAAVGDDNLAAIDGADTAVLAVKPQQMAEVCAELGARLPEKAPLFISIAAGVGLASLRDWLGERARVVRAMPNTPALIGCGAAALFADDAVDAEQRRRAEQIMQSVGLSVWVETEAQLDAVTAISGSGPAYVLRLIEALRDAGRQLGLEADVSHQLSLRTVLGAARLADESDEDVGELRRRVTSPNGTTERALAVLEEKRWAEILCQAAAAAARRAEELAAGA